jgi:tetratricopeptide (TPR) repeat protein
MNSENYYEILGVSETATGAELRKAYIKMIRQYTNETHPEEFQSITKAYKTLEDPEKRQQYEISLRGGGKYQEKLAQIEEYLENEQSHLAMLNILEMSKDYPDDPTVLNLQAECLYLQERYEDSERILKRLLADDPRNEHFLSDLAWIYFLQEDYSSALSLYEKLIQINPIENNYYIRLSKCHFCLEHVDEACQVIENKLSTYGETVYDFPLLSDLYFITIAKNDDHYHQKVVNRIETLAKSSEERETLLNLMIDLAVDINTEHYLFKELAYMIKRINNNQDASVSEWVEFEAEGKMDPDKVYYGDPIPLNQSASELSAATISTAPVRGSIFWAFVFGIIASLFATPIVGIIIGIVYYYKAQKIKEILSSLGCLAAVIFVLVLLFRACSS